MWVVYLQIHWILYIAQSKAECIMNNVKFIVLPASVYICKQNFNRKWLIL